MRDDWERTANGQHGAFAWRQIRHRITRAEARTELRRGTWVALHRGVFCRAECRDELLTRLTAAHLVLGVPAVACLHTAARLHGFGVVSTGLLHLVDPGKRHLLVRRGIALHQLTVPPGDRVSAAGFPATSPARTAIELARATSRPLALAVLDAALRIGVGNDSLDEACAAQAGRRGIVEVRELLALADGRAESPMESHTRLVCHDAGLPTPVPQFEVRDGFGIVRYRLDLAWPAWRVGLEYDSAQFHSGSLAVRRDLARHSWLDEHGWRMVYATADDLRAPERLAGRIRLALARAA